MHSCRSGALHLFCMFPLPTLSEATLGDIDHMISQHIQALDSLLPRPVSFGIRMFDIVVETAWVWSRNVNRLQMECERPFEEPPFVTSLPYCSEPLVLRAALQKWFKCTLDVRLTSRLRARVATCSEVEVVNLSEVVSQRTWGSDGLSCGLTARINCRLRSGS